MSRRNPRRIERTPNIGWLAAILAALLTGPVSAQLPVTELNTVFPPGGQQGQTVEVSISGGNQDEVDQLLFSHKGITAKQKMHEPDDFHKSPWPDEGKFLVDISADVPAGIYEARAVGRFGASNPRAFAVGVNEELIDDGSNKSLDKAREIPVGVVVNGKVDGSTMDYYKFPLKQNQRVLIDCFAQRIDSRMDGTLVVYNEAGVELARSRDAIDKDPLIDFTAPTEGLYVVAVYDFLYNGGGDYFYRLTVHNEPHIDFIFPPAGEAGKSTQFTIYGRNLPGGKPVDGLSIDGYPVEQITASVSLPADPNQFTDPMTAYVTPTSAFLIGQPFRTGNSNAVPIYLGRAPLVLEQGDNDEIDKAQKVSVPCEFAGQFYPARDVDWVEFEAQAGDVLWIDVLSHRLGLNTDPFLIVKRVNKNDQGEETYSDVAQVDDSADRNNSIGSDFDTSTDDPTYKFEVKQDGTYRVMVRDQFGTSRDDPRCVYRLVIRSATPDFQLVALPESMDGANNKNQVLPYSPILRRGGVTQLKVLVDRHDGFRGDIRVKAVDLPGGVSCTETIIGGTATSAYLVLEAAENAANWAGPLKVVGTANIGGQDVTRPATYGTVSWGTNNRGQAPPEFRVARNMTLAVCDKDTMPVSVKVGDGSIIETAVGGKIEVPVKAVRRDSFKGNLKLTSLGLPGQIKPKDVTLNGDATDGKWEVEINDKNTPAGTYTFLLKADTKYKYVRNADALAAAEQRKDELEEIAKTLEEQLKKTQEERNNADKAAKDSESAFKQAEQARAAAENAAKQAEQEEKQAVEKLAQAKQALEQDADNQSLKDAVAAAEKAVEEVSSKKTGAQQQLADAQKALEDSQAALSKAKDELTQLDQTLKQAQDKVNQANKLKQNAEKAVNDTKKANEPKDTNVAIVSTPAIIRIDPIPYEVKVNGPAALKQGGSTEVSISVTRKYGFDDVVEVNFEAPGGTSGISGKQLKIEKGKNDGKLEVSAAENATPGEHVAHLRIRTKFGNVTKDHDVELPLGVEEVKK